MKIWLVPRALSISVALATACPLSTVANAQPASTGAAAHRELLEENRYPSATTCRTCHPQHFEQWSASPHAYAQMSVVFQTMQAAIVTLTNGTNGDFCIRCHTPIGMNLGEPVVLENEKRHPTSREGITCVSCHRVPKNYGRISGRQALTESPLCGPIYGPSGNAQGIDEEVERVIRDPAFKVAGCGEPGRTIHEVAEQRSFLTASQFCGTCHDVRLVNGFRLEDAFGEYAASPAARRGVTCQDCHMGRKPGVPSGYEEGSAALVGGTPTRVRKLTNHRFPGPDYSVIHLGLFPHNSKAAKMASLSEWVRFGYRAGWGDPDSDFEKMAREEKFAFPKEWRSRGKRRRARKLLDGNCEQLDLMERERLAILQEGFRLDEVIVDRSDPKEIEFRVKVASGTDGHGVPTGFDAERIVFLHVSVQGRDGKTVFESGDRDPNGDLRDVHSFYVHNGEVPLDRQLFSLQSVFLTRNLRGTEREQILPINYSIDPLPFLRPEPRATGIYGRPRSARKRKAVILPNMHRWASYRVPLEQAVQNAPYTAQIELVAQMVPANLIHEISFMGFEYGMSARDVADAVVAGAQVVWRREVVLEAGVTTREPAERGEPVGALQCREN